MRYTIRSLWLGWIGVVVALGGAQFAHAQSMATKWLPAVTQIITTTSKGDYATGTGFFIEGGDLITAYHVVQGAKKLRVLMNDGSMREAIVKNFDSERDLAALTLQPPYKPSLQMSLADAPAGLTTASGVVLGHPDQKKDFAIRVSFPTDAPIKAIRWIAPSTGNTTSAFRFETQDLELIVLDGTLNRGMSGGPVLVGDKVVGVFSGGEQRSGAGLAWAIPVKYLKQLKPNGAKLRADQLPRLSMLNQGVEALVPLKRTSSRSASQVMETYLKFAEAAGNLDVALGKMESAVTTLAAICKDSPNIDALEQAGLIPGSTPELTKEPWSFCAGMYLLLTGVIGTSADYAANLREVMRNLDELGPIMVAINESLSGEFQSQMSYLLVGDIRSGYLRRLRSALIQCGGFSANRLEASVGPFLEDLRTIGPAIDGINGRVSVGEFNKASDKNPAKAAMAALGSDAKFRQLVAMMVRSTPGIQRWRKEGMDPLRLHFAQCNASMVGVIESRGFRTEVYQQLTYDDLDEAEAAFVGGVILGGYGTTDTALSQCKVSSSGDQVNLADYHSQWRADWYPAYRKAHDLLKRAGQSDMDIAELKLGLKAQFARMTEIFGGRFASDCGKFSSPGVIVADALAADMRTRGFIDLLDVPTPTPPPQSFATRLQYLLTPVISELAIKSVRSGKSIRQLSLDNALTSLATTGVASAIGRQSEQCGEWYPERQKAIQLQLQKWSDAQGQNLQAAQHHVESMLLQFTDGDKTRAKQLQEQILEKMSTEIVQAMRQEFKLNDKSTDELCNGFASKLGNLK